MIHIVHLLTCLGRGRAERALADMVAATDRGRFRHRIAPGLPAIVSDIESRREVVADGHSGSIVPRARYSSGAVVLQWQRLHESLAGERR